DVGRRRYVELMGICLAREHGEHDSGQHMAACEKYGSNPDAYCGGHAFGSIFSKPRPDRRQIVIHATDGDVMSVKQIGRWPWVLKARGRVTPSCRLARIT